MLRRMYGFIHRHQLWQPADRLVLGLSAGVDSMVMMFLLQELSKLMQLHLVAAHVHHGMRPAADQEAEFLRSHCDEREIPYFEYRIGPDEIHGSSWENQARELRYRFFAEVQNETGGQKIVTAHHRDDVAETMLLHLMRGSGIKGLRGILPKNGVRCRPLLFASKAEIYQYANENGIRYFEDESNRDLQFTRNRVRHQLLPLMEQAFNMQVVTALNDLAKIVRAEDEVMEQLTFEAWQQLEFTENANQIELSARQLLVLPLALQRRVILQTLQKLAGDASWNLQDVERVRSLLEKEGSDKRLHFKKRLIVFKVYDKMVFSLHTISNKIVPFQISLTAPGMVEIPVLGTKYQLSVCPADTKRISGALYFDYDALEWPLFLRSRQPGDYIRPYKRRGKKVKKLLIEYRVPESERNSLPILTSSRDQIYGIFELGIVDAAVAVTENTQRVLEALRLD